MPLRKPAQAGAPHPRASITTTTSVVPGAALPKACRNPAYLPAVMAVVGCAYFIINTDPVSGLLSLLQGKPLGEVCRQ
jgi:hypothetical protein